MNQKNEVIFLKHLSYLTVLHVSIWTKNYHYYNFLYSKSIEIYTKKNLDFDIEQKIR